jgi:hypothetical protein
MDRVPGSIAAFTPVRKQEFVTLIVLIVRQGFQDSGGFASSGPISVAPSLGDQH